MCKDRFFDSRRLCRGFFGGRLLCNRLFGQSFLHDSSFRHSRDFRFRSRLFDGGRRRFHRRRFRSRAHRIRGFGCQLIPAEDVGHAAHAQFAVPAGRAALEFPRLHGRDHQRERKRHHVLHMLAAFRREITIRNFADDMPKRGGDTPALELIKKIVHNHSDRHLPAGRDVRAHKFRREDFQHFVERDIQETAFVAGGSFRGRLGRPHDFLNFAKLLAQEINIGHFGLLLDRRRSRRLHRRRRRRFLDGDGRLLHRLQGFLDRHCALFQRHDRPGRRTLLGGCFVFLPEQSA